MARHLLAFVLALGPLATAFGQPATEVHRVDGPGQAATHTLPAPAASERDSNVRRARAWSCVDPSDALALRKVQDEPCKWPLYQLPATTGPDSAESPRLPSFTSKSTGAGDPLFWRFPVQPMGPFDAPRHGRH